MSSKENVKVNAQELREVTSAGMRAVKRISKAIESKNTEILNFDAEKILSNDIRATVNSIKAEMMAYRIIFDKMN